MMQRFTTCGRLFEDMYNPEGSHKMPYQIIVTAEAYTLSLCVPKQCWNRAAASGFVRIEAEVESYPAGRYIFAFMPQPQDEPC